MFGVYAPGHPYPAQAPNVDPDTLPPPVILRAEDATLRILGPRHTMNLAQMRNTLRILNPRNTIRELEHD